MKITLYSDGACSGNPGPGGYGCILSTVLENGTLYEREYSGGTGNTTNNRMEIAGVIRGLKEIKKPCDVEVISDSQYVCNAYNKGWIDNWKKNNWEKKGVPIPNADYWKILDALVSRQVSVTFLWVKGHAGNKYNERCDRLAVAESQKYKN